MHPADYHNILATYSQICLFGSAGAPAVPDHRASLVPHVPESFRGLGVPAVPELPFWDCWCA
jgi:hypothetical protein